VDVIKYPGNEASYIVQVGGCNQSLSTVLRVRAEAWFWKANGCHFWTSLESWKYDSSKINAKINIHQICYMLNPSNFVTFDNIDLTVRATLSSRFVFPCLRLHKWSRYEDALLALGWIPSTLDGQRASTVARSTGACTGFDRQSTLCRALWLSVQASWMLSTCCCLKNIDHTPAHADGAHKYPQSENSSNSSPYRQVTHFIALKWPPQQKQPVSVY